MAFSWISVSGNGGMGRNHGREIQLERREMMFPWISVGGNDMVRRDWGMLQNWWRKIQLKCRGMMFLWISPGGNGGRRRNWGRYAPVHPELDSESVVRRNRFRVKPG
jgi:hypothetical protein